MQLCSRSRWRPKACVCRAQVAGMNLDGPQNLRNNDGKKSHWQADMILLAEQVIEFVLVRDKVTKQPRGSGFLWYKQRSEVTCSWQRCIT